MILGCAAFGARGAPGLVAARLLLDGLLNRAFRVAQGVGSPAEFGFGAGARGIAGFGKRRPGAAEDGDADGGQFDDAVDALQQRAVVAGHHHAASPAPEQFGDRLPAIGIEVVGGLVQQQHVRRLDQQARQRHARPFAAAQRSEPAIPWQSGQAGFDECRVEPGFQRPVGLGGVIERAGAAFEAAQAGEIVGDAQRLGDRQAVVGYLRECADRA